MVATTWGQGPPAPLHVPSMLTRTVSTQLMGHQKGKPLQDSHRPDRTAGVLEDVGSELALALGPQLPLLCPPVVLARAAGTEAAAHPAPGGAPKASCSQAGEGRNRKSLVHLKSFTL